MNVTSKTVIKAAALVGAVVALIGFAKPVVESGPLPLAGKKDVADEDAKIVELAQNFAAMQKHQDVADQNAYFLAQGFLTNQIALAEDQLRRNPGNVAARQQKAAAEAQLRGISKKLYGK